MEKNVIYKLLAEEFLPSLQLKQILDKLIRRARYPIEVAITGQFSSGKSTFLNALLSRDILPTGITPVASKVNFINYGNEFKLKEQISQSEALHMKEPSRFHIHPPRDEDIFNNLKKKLTYNKIEDFLTQRRNVIFKVTQYGQKEFQDIHKNKKIFINQKKETYLKK